MKNISDLKFDDKNFNKHTEHGMGLLEKSLGKFGAGRSILIDKYGNIIAGNGIVEAAGNIGLEDVEIVKSDGKKIIAVQRTDIELDSEAGREMALADNATASADLAWDEENIKEQEEAWGFDADDWIKGFDDEKEEKFQDIDDNMFVVEIYCDDEEMQEQIYDEMQKRGIKCKIS